MVVQESDSEKTPSPQLVKKARTLKSKPAATASLSIFSAITSEAPIAAVTISVVKATTDQAPVSKTVEASIPKSAKISTNLKE